MRLKDRTVFLDFRTDPTENVWPMVKAGKGITEMLLGPRTCEPPAGGGVTAPRWRRGGPSRGPLPTVPSAWPRAAVTAALKSASGDCT
jgi:hypothetical protein